MTPPDAPRPDPDAPAERWARERALVAEALALAPGARAAFLDASCGGDARLRERVERLVAACDREDDGWGFLARPAGELAAPLLADPLLAAPLLADAAASAELPLRRARAETAGLLARLNAALAGRYDVEREIASGGMATVFLARDVRHGRPVALKVLHPELSAALGDGRFLKEIRTTAALQHPHILPLFDSGAADGLLFYVMPLVEGETLRARLAHERQLPVADAVRIAGDVAGALDYAHRRGVVHRDVKPENVLLHEGRPLVADFGIALAVESAAGGERLTRPGSWFGAPPYMSPEQAAGDAAVDGRSDVYALACVLYEMLVGDPPFTGRTAQVVIARVLAETPSRVRAVRPSVPDHVDAAIARALSKLPADRHATAREFADALLLGPPAIPTGATSVAPAPAPARAPAARWRDPVRLALGAAAAAGLAAAAWSLARPPAAPAEVTRISYHNLVDQTPFGEITITPNGRALVYTGTGEPGRPVMLLPLDGAPARALPGTGGGESPVVAADGRRLAVVLRGQVQVVPTGGDATGGDATGGDATSNRARAWRYGNAGWLDDATFVTAHDSSHGLSKRGLRDGTAVALTRPDPARGEFLHAAPLVLPGGRAVVFTVGMHGGPRTALAGPLAIAPVGPGASPAPHVVLGVSARRAVAFVDGWLLFTSADGLAIMAAPLDVARRRITGPAIPVLEVAAGSVETGALADDGSLLYVRRPRADSLVVVDSAGRARPLLPGARGSFMNPRLTRDGRRVAVQAATGDGGQDVWVYDLATQAPTRLTTTGSALHPTWTPDGRRILFTALRRGLMSQPADGGAAATLLAGTAAAFGPTVTPDGKSFVFQQRSPAGWGVWLAPASGEGPPRAVADDRFAHYMPAVSPDGHWLADVSSATGQNEVYVRPFPGPGAAVQVSAGGGTEPAWSPDGHRIYYRTRGAFMAAEVTTPALAVTSRRRLFADPFGGAMPHRNYDVMPDGSGFLMISGGSSEAVVVLNWLSELRARLARER